MRRAVRAIVIADDRLLVMKRSKFGQQFYTLLGGSIDPDETFEQAVIREVSEEASVEVTGPRLVFVEQAGDPFGTQYIYLCQYVRGEPQLQTNSPEQAINKLGQNLYQPLWVSVDSFASLPFRSKKLQEQIMRSLDSGFPKEALTFSSEAEISSG